jgi:ubiquitin C-terminal hydrolase
MEKYKNKKRIKLRNYLSYEKQNIFGIPNFGNNCYMNSVFQLIIRNPIFNDVKILNKMQITKLNNIFSKLFFHIV